MEVVAYLQGDVSHLSGDLSGSAGAKHQSHGMRRSSRQLCPEGTRVSQVACAGPRDSFRVLSSCIVISVAASRLTESEMDAGQGVSY